PRSGRRGRGPSGHDGRDASASTDSAGSGCPSTRGTYRERLARAPPARRSCDAEVRTLSPGARPPSRRPRAPPARAPRRWPPTAPQPMLALAQNSRAHILAFVSHIGASSMLGELEQVVLLAVMRVGDEAYGVPVLHEIERQTGRDLALAAVYKTLARLEDKGLV